MLMRGCGALPLFARLSPAKQDRIFDGHSGFSVDAGVCILKTLRFIPSPKLHKTISDQRVTCWRDPDHEMP